MGQFPSQFPVGCTSACTPTNAPSCWEVFNDADATIYDVEFSGGIVYAGDISIPYANIMSVALLCPETAVAQVVTITPKVLEECCDGTTNYNLTLTWLDSCNGNNQLTYRTSMCCGSFDASDIVAALILEINNNPSSIVTASGTTTLVLTAKTAGQGFVVYTDSTHFSTPVLTTANVKSFGSVSEFESFWNIPASEFPDASATYQVMLIKYWSIVPTSTELKGTGVQGVQVNTCAVIVQTGGTAESLILSDTDKLCDIVSGSYSEASAYYAKYSGTCPCA